jgi:hypothetical protein
VSKYRDLIPYLEAQAKLETANYTSNVYKKLNNLFGMKMPKERPTTATASNIIAEGRPYAKYENNDSSIKDMILYLDYVGFPHSVPNAEAFVRELFKRSYFGSGQLFEYHNYLKNIKYWLGE